MKIISNQINNEFDNNLIVNTMTEHLKIRFKFLKIL